jgi:hypothetical protein
MDTEHSEEITNTCSIHMDLSKTHTLADMHTLQYYYYTPRKCYYKCRN